MAFELRDGSGSLFKNDRKEKETHADYRGDCKIDGTEYWLSAWVKESKNGKFFSLSIKPKDSQTAPRPSTKSPEEEYHDSDLPF